jgi:hypothetical protein
VKFQKILITLLTLNLAIVGFLYAKGQADHANDSVPILRVRALELVDDHGRVRGELKVTPAEPALKMPDGTTGYPEGVQLRLFSSQGAPNVKLGVTEDGSGLVLGGDKSYVQILSRGSNPFIKILNKDGREQVLKP